MGGNKFVPVRNAVWNKPDDLLKTYAIQNRVRASGADYQLASDLAAAKCELCSYESGKAAIRLPPNKSDGFSRGGGSDAGAPFIAQAPRLKPLGSVHSHPRYLLPFSIAAIVQDRPPYKQRGDLVCSKLVRFRSISILRGCYPKDRRNALRLSLKEPCSCCSSRACC